MALVLALVLALVVVVAHQMHLPAAALVTLAVLL
jgi:hypothetical protein